MLYAYEDGLISEYKDGLINEYEVYIKSEKLMKVREEIINNCSVVKHESSFFPICDDFEFKKKVQEREHDEHSVIKNLKKNRK